MREEFLQFYSDMQTSEDYLRMEHLKDGYSYKIVARNAYVGVWIDQKKGFLISRYKVGPNPNLFIEDHWDTWTPDNPNGTAKPLQCIEKFPFELRESLANYSEEEELLITRYLDKLEEDNPIVNGFNSLQARKAAAIQFAEILSR